MCVKETTPYSESSVWPAVVRAVVVRYFIPAKSELTSTLETSVQRMSFVGFSMLYKNISRYDLWFEPQLETLTKEEKVFL